MLHFSARSVQSIIGRIQELDFGLLGIFINDEPLTNYSLLLVVDRF